jgi:ABC-type phosphate/phosphonate transport system substrate-binding protein
MLCPVLLLMGQTQIHSQEHKQVRIGYLASMFTGVDLKDAEAALEIWAGKFSERVSLGRKPVGKIYETLDDMHEDLENGRVDIVALHSLDYLKIREHTLIEPVLIASRHESAVEEYVLLVHSQSGIRNLDQLEGKRVLFHLGGRSEMPMMWLDLTLSRRGHRKLGQFFKEVEVVERVSQALLPVFFQQKDACVIPSSGYATMQDLNPQIGEDIALLENSPGFVFFISCVRTDLDPAFKQNVIDSALNLHATMEGQQILLLFKTKRIIVFKPEYLDTVRELAVEHKALMKIRGITSTEK